MGYRLRIGKINKYVDYSEGTEPFFKHFESLLRSVEGMAIGCDRGIPKEGSVHRISSGAVGTIREGFSGEDKVNPYIYCICGRAHRRFPKGKEMKSEQEVKDKMEEALAQSEKDDNDDPSYALGVANALGWVLGQYDDPMEE